MLSILWLDTTHVVYMFKQSLRYQMMIQDLMHCLTHQSLRQLSTTTTDLNIANLSTTRTFKITFTKLTRQRYSVPHWSFRQDHNQRVHLLKKYILLVINTTYFFLMFPLLQSYNVTDQEEEARACQPEVPSPMTIDVEILSRQMTVRIEYL